MGQEFCVITCQLPFENVTQIYDLSRKNLWKTRGFYDNL